ncbi:MAG: helix-turn-helix domain-containing protein [Patescibacteria group bacterium]
MVRLGQRLHEARLQKELTLEEVARATKIKSQFLSAIEKGEYAKLPSPAYAQGFVKNYAAYLGLPTTESLALFRREYDGRKAYRVLPDSLAKPKTFSSPKIRMQQSLMVVILILVAIAAYLAFQYRYLVLPPSLTIDTPKEEQLDATTITVSGKSDPNATVSINNQSVAITSDGTFSKTMIVFPGKSIITIKAKNRMGKETVERREINVVE